MTMGLCGRCFTLEVRMILSQPWMTFKRTLRQSRKTLNPGCHPSVHQRKFNTLCNSEVVLPAFLALRVLFQGAPRVFQVFFDSLFGGFVGHDSTSVSSGNKKYYTRATKSVRQEGVSMNS
jgi:hypothetical protein